MATKKPVSPKPTALIILDGFGYRPEEKNNAIALAHTPFLDSLFDTYPNTLISASGEDVGLPPGQMGNSEVGHLHMGAGRRMLQSLSLIHDEIETKAFFDNPILCQSIDAAVKNNQAVHIIALLSSGGVHAHEAHIFAALKLSKQRGAKKIFIHVITDGRDSAPKCIEHSLKKLEQLGIGQIATMVGRYYAMDRDNNWSRIKLAYDLIVNGSSDFEANSAQDAVNEAYAREESDEFIKPTTITHAPIQTGDSVMFMNFRADRGRQLTQALTVRPFEHFQTKDLKLNFVTLTEYKKGLPVQVAYPNRPPKNGLGEYISSLNLHQLRIAETEKYAHVTFFFNGGIETPFKNEARALIPSPKVATYDLQPEMSAPGITTRLVKEIEANTYDLIICNYANADMVGHTGNLTAAIKAVEALDKCLEQVIGALQKAGGEALITADHGNAELMKNVQTGQPHTAHTNLLVPLIYVGRKLSWHTPEQQGSLSDIAPTLLSLMNLAIPTEMTGNNLLEC